MPHRNAEPIPIYIRVSSEEQVQGTSLETQLRDCRSAAERAGFSPGQLFEDAGESAKTQDRPRFLDLLDFVEKTRPPAVVVWKLDRLARNTLDSSMIRERFRQAGCRLISATETLTDDPSGKFLADILSAAAEWDNSIRAERSRRGMTSRASEGIWVNAPPLGYVAGRDAKDKPQIQPDPDRAPLVLRLFSRVSSGASQAVAREEATKAGLRTRKGKALSKQSVSYLLTSEVYAGWMMHEGKRIRGNWQPIVPQDVWDKVQLAIEKPAAKRRTAKEFPLRGLLSCGACGATLTASYSQGRDGTEHGYYHCHKCDATRIRCDDAEARLQDRVTGLAIAPWALTAMEKILSAHVRDRYGDATDTKGRLQAVVDGVEKRIDRLVEMRLDGGIDRERYDLKYKALERDLIGARHALHEASQEKIDVLAEFHRASALLADPGRFWSTASAEIKHLTMPLFFVGLVPVLSGPNKKARTASLGGSSCPIWLPKLDLVPTLDWLSCYSRILPAA